MRNTLIASFVFVTFFASFAHSQTIDREALVKRHTPRYDAVSPTELPQVGNGEIAFGIDATGLQTFHGNIMSHWGWHSYPCPVEGGHDALKLENFDFHGRQIGLRTSDKGQERLYSWMRENPHRINLGRLRFLLKKEDQTIVVDPGDIKEILQELDIWSGIIESRYSIEGVPVEVTTCVAPESGALAVRVVSPLISSGRLQVELAFPYGYHGLTGADWTRPHAHRTVISAVRPNGRSFQREMDSTNIGVVWEWSSNAAFAETASHTYVLTPDHHTDHFEFTTCFSPEKPMETTPDFEMSLKTSQTHWLEFWRSGGAIDLSESTDARWKELERRIVLSQYLMAVNGAGSHPPQESGLFNNGWYGKFHLEMHWWHGTHYALWGRWPLFERSLHWYHEVLPKAEKLAESQGFKGARWPKMVGPDAEDSPSGIGPLLIWQQPNPIFYAELEYRLSPTTETLAKWSDIVQKSAEFMVDFAFFDVKTDRYVLGPPLKTVPENTDPKTTFNPTFELSYWRSGLRWAQQWRERQGLPREKHWDEVIEKLAELPQHEGAYLQQEGMTETFTRYRVGHPSLIGPGGMLPSDGTDPETVKRTVQKVWAAWDWNSCWGWDYPMIAMAAAKSGRRDIAIDVLLHPSETNAMNRTGLSLGGPFPYFPSNGGLLYAVALMAAGWDGAPDGIYAPGFPQDGSWKVRFEGLTPAP